MTATIAVTATAESTAPTVTGLGWYEKRTVDDPAGTRTARKL
jgi:hypothetical protein